MRPPRALERVAASWLRAGADDSRLGDLSEQYARHLRRAQAASARTAWSVPCARLVADTRYALAVINVTFLARTIDSGLPWAEPAAAQPATPIATEGTMALSIPDAAPRWWLKGALLLTALAFLLVGAVDLRSTWVRTEALMVGLQRGKAEATAAQIDQFLVAMQDKLAASTDRAASPPEQRRLDYLRLLRQTPEIAEIAHLDTDGKETLWISRNARDTVGSGTDYAGDLRFTEARKRKSHVGPVHFRKAAEPYVSIAVARGGADSGVTLAEVSLRRVWEAVRAVKAGESGYAYIVDGNGRLLAGPDMNVAVQRPDVLHLPQVAVASSGSASPVAREGGTFASSLSGAAVLSAHAVVPASGWRVFVELPIEEARSPLWGALLRGTCVLALGLAAVALAGLAAGRLAPSDGMRRSGRAPSSV
jgi:hypothetical protein